MSAPAEHNPIKVHIESLSAELHGRLTPRSVPSCERTSSKRSFHLIDQTPVCLSPQNRQRYRLTLFITGQSNNLGYLCDSKADTQASGAPNGAHVMGSPNPLIFLDHGEYWFIPDATAVPIDIGAVAEYERQ